MGTDWQYKAAAGSRPILTFVLAIVASALPFRGQAAGAQTADEAIPAAMLRVLAEAADGFRTGRPVFFVADRRFPYDIVGAFPSRTAAQAVQTDSGSSFGVFGPYVTPPDRVTDTTSRVIGVRLTLETPRGREYKDLDPGKVDAVFLSPSAVDKFLLPYYTRVYGPQYAAKLQSIVLPGRKPVCHGFSRPCTEEGQFITVWRPGDSPF